MSTRSRLRIARHVAFVALVGACAALAVLNVQAWRGALVDDERTREAPAAAVQAPPPDATSTSAEAESALTGTVSPATTAPPPGADGVREPAGATTTLSVVGTKGPCWLLARAGSSTGEILYEGMVARGRTLTFSRERVWLRLGAAQNVRLVLNGEPARAVPGGTVDLVATAGGVEPAGGGA